MRQNRLNTEVAWTYRHDRMLRGSLDALRAYGLNSRRMKCAIGAAVFQRLVPKAFACLQMNTKVCKVKQAMKCKATQMHDVQLIRKVMSALIYNAIHMKKSNQ